MPLASPTAINLPELLCARRRIPHRFLRCISLKPPPDLPSKTFFQLPNSPSLFLPSHNTSTLSFSPLPYTSIFTQAFPFILPFSASAVVTCRYYSNSRILLSLSCHLTLSIWSCLLCSSSGPKLRVRLLFQAISLFYFSPAFWLDSNQPLSFDLIDCCVRSRTSNHLPRHLRLLGTTGASALHSPLSRMSTLDSSLGSASMSLRSFSNSSQRHEQDSTNIGDPQTSASNMVSPFDLRFF